MYKRFLLRFIHGTFLRFLVFNVFVFLQRFSFSKTLEMAYTYYKQQFKMTFSYATVYDVRQYVLQFYCNYLCACSTAALE